MLPESLPRPPDDESSALKDLLRHTTIYEKAGAVAPLDLLRFGLFGSLLVIAAGLLALMLPTPDAIRSSDFFLVLDEAAADLTALMHSLALPAIGVGAGLLLLDVYLIRVPTSARWRGAVVAQAAAGGAGVTTCTLFLALVVLNLAIWILIFACLIAILGVFLAALGGGS